MANKEAKKPTTKPPASPIKNAYLILYNAVSASLWLAVMVKTVTTIVAGGGPAAVFDTTGEFCKWTQTLAGMEVLHSLLGTCPALTSRETEEEGPEREGGFYIAVES